MEDQGSEILRNFVRLDSYEVAELGFQAKSTLKACAVIYWVCPCSFFIYLFFLTYFSWMMIALQCCVDFCYTT